MRNYPTLRRCSMLVANTLQEWNQLMRPHCVGSLGPHVESHEVSRCHVEGRHRSNAEKQFVIVHNRLRSEYRSAGKPIAYEKPGIGVPSTDPKCLFGGHISSANDEAWHPLPGAPLRFWLRLLTALRLRLRAGSGLPSAALFGFPVRTRRGIDFESLVAHGDTQNVNLKGAVT